MCFITSVYCRKSGASIGGFGATGLATRFARATRRPLFCFSNRTQNNHDTTTVPQLFHTRLSALAGQSGSLTGKQNAQWRQLRPHCDGHWSTGWSFSLATRQGG